MDIIKQKIQNKYSEISENKINKINLLQQSGSYRKYYRITEKNSSILGVYNPDKDENLTFISFTQHFYKNGFNVPKIIANFPEDNIYFIEDLGNETLFDFLKNTPSTTDVQDIYKKVIDELIKIQFEGIKNLDLSVAYPRKEFDIQSIMWDLNYFKYFVLKIGKVTFNEQKLENDFNKFAEILTKTDTNFFLYRDFQSKNIMLKDNKVYFIDYQGGRKGAFYYDLASLLNDSKAKLSIELKNNLLIYYHKKIQSRITISFNDFKKQYFNYALVRQLQAFGAYGFRGLVEKKLNFIQSIPQAIENVKFLINQNHDLEYLPELKKSLENLIYSSEIATEFAKTTNNVLISINSFSFKKTSYPEDATGNGGGFVFDCRFLPNPGREEKYKKLTGKNAEVIDYFKAYPQVETFIAKTAEIIKEATNSYQKLGYKNLQVNFGCTGGQHRSIYCAEQVNKILRETYNFSTTVSHTQFEHI